MKRLFMILIMISVVCISCNGNTVKKTVADADDHSNATDTDTSNTGNDNDFADTGNTGDDLSNTGNDTGDTEPDEANTGDTDTDTDTGNTTTDDDAVPNCTSGKTECQDNEVYKCEDSTWTLWDECTKQNKICAIQQGIATCIEGEMPDEGPDEDTYIPDLSMWSKTRSEEELSGSEARTWCDSLSEDGHTDWRAPDIDELRTLIRNCPTTEDGGACKTAPYTAEYCKGCLPAQEVGYYNYLDNDDTILISGAAGGWSFIVDFGTAQIRTLSKSYVRCIR